MKHVFPDLNVAKVEKLVAIAYHFKFTEPFGWAIFTVNDGTGEFSVQSDWGNYSYRWNTGALGSASGRLLTLTEFLGRSCRGDASYVVDKFSYGLGGDKHPSLESVIDARATRLAMKKHLAQRVRDDELDHGVFTDAIHDIRTRIDFDNVEMVWRTMTPDLEEAMGPEWWTYGLIETRRSWRYEFLRLHLLPFFGNHLRSEAKAAA